MQWKQEAVEKLTQLDAKKKSLELIPMELARIASEMDSIKTRRPDSPMGNKGSNRGKEDLILNCIAQSEELKRNLERTRIWVEAVSKAMETLTPEERLILDRFYVNPERGAAEDLADSLMIDRKTVYARKDTALWRFTTALYGYVSS